MCKTNATKDVMVKQMAEQHSKIIEQTEYIKQLELRLASIEQKAATPGSNTAALDLSPWYTRIDEIYAALNSAVEHYYTMMSKERVLQFRKQFKQRAKEIITEYPIDVNDQRPVSAKQLLIYFKFHYYHLNKIHLLYKVSVFIANEFLLLHLKQTLSLRDKFVSNLNDMSLNTMIFILRYIRLSFKLSNHLILSVFDCVTAFNE